MTANLYQHQHLISLKAGRGSKKKKKKLPQLFSDILPRKFWSWRPTNDALHAFEEQIQRAGVNIDSVFGHLTSSAGSSDIACVFLTH